MADDTPAVGSPAAEEPIATVGLFQDLAERRRGDVPPAMGWTGGVGG